jgi:hypothetical protein
MRIEKKDMPKVKLLMDVGSNWNNTEYIASFLVAWKDESHFVATNAAAILFHKHVDVGLSFSQSRFGMQFGLKGGMTKRTFLLQPGRNNSTQP